MSSLINSNFFLRINVRTTIIINLLTNLVRFAHPAIEGELWNICMLEYRVKRNLMGKK